MKPFYKSILFACLYIAGSSGSLAQKAPTVTQSPSGKSSYFLIKPKSSDKIKFSASGGKAPDHTDSDAEKDGAPEYVWTFTTTYSATVDQSSGYIGDSINVDRAKEGTVSGSVLIRQKWKKDCQSLGNTESGPADFEVTIQKPTKIGSVEGGFQ